MTLLLVLLACGDPGPGAADASRAYASALGDADAVDPAACALPDADVAADCAAVVAGRRIARGLEPVEVACGRVPDGAWRDECRFAAAEAAMKRGEVDVAVAACRAVETFRDACAQHLWDPELAGVWQRAGGDWARARGDAGVLFATWDARLGDVTDLDDRYWRHFYRFGFAATVLPEDPDRFCGGEATARRRACQKAWARAVAAAPPAR